MHVNIGSVKGGTGRYLVVLVQYGAVLARGLYYFQNSSFL